MDSRDRHIDIKRLSLAGVLVTLGIVFGDLGTSPLYVMKAIVRGGEFNELLIYGSLSLVFWTLTLQTTTKYIIIALRADNNGEGGILSLFALIRKKSSWVAILTMIGASALLADGVITPAITVTSSIEGLKLLNPEIPVVLIVLIIFAVLFFVQQFGTNLLGSSFGPIMVIWFLMLGVLGFSQLILHPGILKALNPVYAYRFLNEYPGGFISAWSSISLHNRSRGTLCRSGTLRKKKHPGFMDICKDCLANKLFRTGSMADEYMEILGQG